MAYCRFSDADAYIYDDANYGLVCCACWIMPDSEIETDLFGEYQRYFINENFVAGNDYDKMLDHVAEHRAQDQYIPDHVDRRLIMQRDCTHNFNEFHYCTICWAMKYIEDYHDSDD